MNWALRWQHFDIELDGEDVICSQTEGEDDENGKERMLGVDLHRLHSLCSKARARRITGRRSCPAVGTDSLQCLPVVAPLFSYTTDSSSTILLHKPTTSYKQCPPRGGQAALPAHLPIATRDGTTNCHPARSRPLPQTSPTIPCIHDLVLSTLPKSLVRHVEPPELSTQSPTTSTNRASTMKQTPMLMAMSMATMRSLAVSAVCKTTQVRL